MDAMVDGFGNGRRTGSTTKVTMEGRGARPGRAVVGSRKLCQTVTVALAGLVGAPGCGDDSRTGGGDAGLSADAAAGRSRDASDDTAATVVDAGASGVSPAGSGSVNDAATHDQGRTTAATDSPSFPATSDGAASDDPPGTAPTPSASSDVGTDSASEASTPDLERWAEAAPLLTNQGIARIDLQLPEESEAGLRVDPSTYVHGALRVTLANGATLELNDVGVRLKGRYGSARTLDEKCAFLLKSNEFIKGQRLFGLNKLAVNNLVQDASMLREQLSYELFREMGVAAPRTGFARVTVNGQLKGLYATVEVVDNTEFLDHWFANADGRLYEGAYGSDMESDLIPSFDQDRGDDVAFADLYELTSALDQMSNPETFASDVAAWVNLDSYVKFAATELFLSHWDGYAATRNNYFVYRPVGAPWHWLPWGTDQTFGDSGADVWNGTGRIQQMCEASLGCRQKLASAYEQLVQLVDELDLLDRVDALEALISDAVAEDPAKEYDTETVHDAIAQLRTYLQDRPSAVDAQLVCVDPSNVDEDGDGASACNGDCNDADDAVYPGAYEACNFVDDDCSGAIDDANDCPQCALRTDDNAREYAFCFGQLTYAAAQTECQNMGGGLVSIHDQYLHGWLSDTAGALNVGSEWWIGLSDSDDEGLFRWDDGSAVDYTTWNTGEPNDWGGNEDCAELAWGIWNDLPCDYSIGYICAL